MDEKIENGVKDHLLEASSYTPWTDYAARRYCSTLDDFVDASHCPKDVWGLPKVYQPGVQVAETGTKVVARLPPTLEYRLFDKDDLIWWRGSTKKINVINNFQGRIGERLLSLVLRGFMNEMVLESQRAGYSQTSGGILKERRKKEGKPFHKHVVQWNDSYLLKFDRRTTFVLLQKADAGQTLHYIRELHIQKCEIDGLASLYLRGPSGDDEEQKYLLIAEVNTTRRERLWPNSWDLKSPRPSGERIESRLFEPLASLFPGYQLVYLLMGHTPALFTKNSALPYPTLTKNCATIAERLTAAGIVPLFIPIPAMVNCAEIAQRCYDSLVRYRQEMK
ncbi:hypothetical protein HYU22_03720 [Candidatus Woesearchaeota archaeon]|nr:hypothetical protein [Candidatus Woesearchaeota archaeon]